MLAHRIARGLLLAVIGVALVGAPTVSAAAPAAVSPAAGATIMVAKDGHASPGNCNGSGAAETSIQQAVDDSSDGDTILVCPGVYKEQVTVVEHSGLTIKSVVPFAAIIKTPKFLNEPYLVGIGISADITFQGFKLLVLARAAHCQALEFGILTSEATGIVIRGNRIQTTGDQTLTGPCGLFVGIQVGDPSGFIAPITSSTAASRATATRHSWGTSPASNPISRAVVAYNLITNFQFIGIDVTGAGTDADVQHNSLHFYHLNDPDTGSCSFPLTTSGIAAAGPALLGVHPSSSAQCLGLGIVEANHAGGDISFNAVHSGALIFSAGNQAVLLAGILLWDQRHAAGKSDVTDNQVFRTVVGIALLDGDGSYLAHNSLSKNVAGIFVHQTQGVTVEDNTSVKNGVGIGVNDMPLFGSGGPDDFGRTSSSNVFQDNEVTNNDLIGHASNTDGYSTTYISCFDNTVGSGSQGTDNTWTSNNAELNSSDPLQICGSAI